jgi:hypothetical protein
MKTKSDIEGDIITLAKPEESCKTSSGAIQVSCGILSRAVGVVSARFLGLGRFALLD